MFAAYNRLLTRHPMTTKMLTTATLFSLGDIITQKGNTFFIQSSTKRNLLIGKETLISSLLEPVTSHPCFIIGIAEPFPTSDQKFLMKPHPKPQEFSFLWLPINWLLPPLSWQDSL